MKNVKNRVKKILRHINLDKESMDIFADIVDYIDKNNIHVLDINLTRSIYPMISESYDLTAESVEKKLLKALKASYGETDPLVYSNTLGYKKRITIKKLIMVLLLKLTNEETV